MTAPPPARPPPPPPPSARPAPSPGPRPPRSPCRGTPASTASRPRRCRPPPSSPRPRRPRPAPAPRPCAGPAAGISSARPPCLPVLICNISPWTGAAAATQKTRFGPTAPSIGCPVLGQGRGPARPPHPRHLPFSFRLGWGKRKETPKNQQKTHRIGDYLFVFNLFCHIFVKRQKCNKKYISTVLEDRAVEGGSGGPVTCSWCWLWGGPSRPRVGAPPIPKPPPKNWVLRPQMENSRLHQL